MKKALLNNPDVLAGFLRRVAHDVRSPLSIFSNTLSLLKANTHPSSAERQHTLVLVARRSVQKLLYMSDRFNCIARLLQAPVLGAKQVVDLNALLSSVMAILETVEPKKDVTVSLNIASHAASVHADEELLLRAVLELCVNAVRHATRTVKIATHTADGHLELRVEDDGPGLAQDAWARVVNNNETNVQTFSGMGLSMAHLIATAHGGTLKLDSSHDDATTHHLAGARVTLSLPL